MISTDARSPVVGQMRAELFCLLALGLTLAFFGGCTARLYTPTITEIAAGPGGDIKLPTNGHVWFYTEQLMAAFMRRVDLDAGVDFGGNVLDAGLSAATLGLGVSGAGAPMIAYMANAEGLLRRLLNIANPVVRGNALAAGVRSLRMARSQFLVDLSAENDGRIPPTAGASLTPAGVKFFQAVEASVNMVIAGLQGSWPSLPELIQATPTIVAPAPGGGIDVQSLQPAKPKKPKPEEKKPASAPAP